MKYKLSVLTIHGLPTHYPSGQGQLMTMGTPMQQARNFAVMTGVNSGISTLMRRVRGTEDVRNR